jgi:LuxR family maltose regulon positive regulatory protein
MPAALLLTKLYLPPYRPGMVLRPRLVERLNRGLHGRLALISAPAGFGKTTLVSEWLAACPHPAAWLSLDAGDNDPTRFLTYLAAALGTAAAGLGAGALAALQSSQPPPPESVLTILLNEIAHHPGSLVLVLDDVHVIEAAAVDQALAFLVEHLPPQLHLVLTTRQDPPLPLARLRARGQLTELRAADLRFTPGEAADFLNRVMGLHLAAEDIAALETRTEGWIAGLQLAALSLQGREDVGRFIQAFTGSHRFVLDYLVEEVLQHQPEPLRRFLLHTSILERFCAPLCAALVEGEDGREMLDALERSSLFLVPLDDQRQWYRYHHLFAEVLQAHLRDEQPGLAPELHRRASRWFAAHELTAEAVRHALAAQDFEPAADLIERAWLAMDVNYQSAAWLSWAQALPEALVRSRPVLSAGYGWALLGVGELEASEARLRHAERWLEPAGEPPPEPGGGMVVADEAVFRTLPASIAAARAYRALALGDIPATKAFARQALALSGAEDTLHRTQATALLGLAEYASGDLAAAEQELLRFQALMWQAGDLANAISITFILAAIKEIQGRLHEAVGAYRQSLQQASSRGATSFLGASDLHRGLGELLCEQGRLEEAGQHLQTARQLGELGCLTGWPHRLCTAQARMQQAQGNPAGALALLDAAERQYVRNPLPERPIAALRARAQARLGQLPAALAWAEAQGLTADDELSFGREFEHLTLARVLAARGQAGPGQGDLHAALGLLERLLQAAGAGGRQGSAIEILVVQALAYHALGEQPPALAALGRALALAEAQGYLRIFADEGEALRGLLERLARQRDFERREYAQRLLAAFPPAAAVDGPAAPPHPPGLVEPLSERELEVLRLLRSDMSGPEIAGELVVSLNTLRTHTRSIFNKLGVNNRRAAVRRAAELGLF